MTELETLKGVMKTAFAGINGPATYTHTMVECDTDVDNPMPMESVQFPRCRLAMMHVAFEDESDAEPDIGTMPMTATWMVEGWIAHGYEDDIQTALNAMLEDFWTVLKNNQTWSGAVQATYMVDAEYHYSDKLSGVSLEYKTTSYKAR